MKKSMVTLKSVTIRGFKNIKELTLPLKRLNEFYGQNQTGKSSVLEAIQFVFMGKKADGDKVNIGSEKAEIDLEVLENNIPIKVKAKISDSGGSPTWSMKMKGVGKSNPREILKRMFSFGTFNPREMLKPADRLARLLQLIPLKVTKEDLIMPGSGKPFPIMDESGLDFDLHAYQVLQDLESDLRNHRHSLYQKKDLLNKSYQKRELELDSQVVDFKRDYGDTDPFKVVQSHEETIRDDEKIEQGIINLTKELAKEDEERESKEKEYKTLKRDIDYNYGLIQERKDSIQAEKERIRVAELEIKDHEADMKRLQKEVLKLEGNLTTNEKWAETSKQKIRELSEKRESLRTKKGKNTMALARSKEVQRLKDSKQSLEKDSKEVEKATGEWESMDRIVKVELKKFMAKVLEPIQKKVPGLAVKDGKFTLNGVSLDTLSGSEVIKLGIHLMRLDQKGSNLILINEAEAIDSDSLKDFEFDTNEQVLIARVGDEPLGGQWNSVKMAESSVNNTKSQKA